MKRKVGKELEEGSKKRQEGEVTLFNPLVQSLQGNRQSITCKKHAKHTIYSFKKEKNWVSRRQRRPNLCAGQKTTNMTLKSWRRWMQQCHNDVWTQPVLQSCLWDECARAGSSTISRLHHPHRITSDQCPKKLWRKAGTGQWCQDVSLVVCFYCQSKI